SDIDRGSRDAEFHCELLRFFARCRSSYLTYGRACICLRHWYFRGTRRYFGGFMNDRSRDWAVAGATDRDGGMACGLVYLEATPSGVGRCAGKWRGSNRREHGRIVKQDRVSGGCEAADHSAT